MPEYVSSMAPSLLPCSVHCGGKIPHPSITPYWSILHSHGSSQTGGAEVGKPNSVNPPCPSQECLQVTGEVAGSPAVQEARGGPRQPRRAVPTNSKSLIPLAQQGMGHSHSGEVWKPGKRQGLPERPEWSSSAFLWDRHSKSVNIQEPHLCAQPGRPQEITVRAPHIFWLFRTQIF